MTQKTWGRRCRRQLRHRATSRKVAGLIPDGVFGNFHWHHPSGSTQPLTETYTRNISWKVKAAGAYGWPYHLNVSTAWKSGSLSLLEPSGLSRLAGDTFTFTKWISCLPSSSGYNNTLTTQTNVSPETSVNLYQTTRRHIPEDGYLHPWRLIA
jgi:hypothetical protein